MDLTWKQRYWALIIGWAFAVPGYGSVISAISPPSNLLPPGSTSVAISFQTSVSTTCGYALGTAVAFTQMQSIDTTPSSSHNAVISGLSADPRSLNQLYVRCAAQPDEVASAVYRAVASPSGAYPRIGSIWWGTDWIDNDPAHAQKLQLMLAPGTDPAMVTAQRAKNSNQLYLYNVNATSDVQLLPGFTYAPAPESYYLHDVHGQRILIWPPNEYEFNLTKPEVAEFIAQRAYGVLAYSNFAYDGIFLDNFARTIAQLNKDFYGNAVQLDANNDGIADDPTTLDAAWGAGIQHLLDTFKKLAPYAYLSGHLSPYQALQQDLAAFNGDALLGPAVNIREGTDSFSAFLNTYSAWMGQSQSPPITLVQAGPPNQISYGYGIHPTSVLLASTVDFGRTYFANMRFGLGIATLQNGFFTYDFGDVSSPVTWWYDEYDFKLGNPISSATVVSPGVSASSLITNGDFSSGLSRWFFGVFNDGVAQASAIVSAQAGPQGNASAQVTIERPGTDIWHIELDQFPLSFVAGKAYRLIFNAQAAQATTLRIHTQGGAPNFANYGLDQEVAITTNWQTNSVIFTANATVTDGRLQFWFDGDADTIWISNVSLVEQPAQVLRRDFENGIVLVNGTNKTQSISLEDGFRRFVGAQAPKFDFIIDDSDSAFQPSGSWNVISLDVGGSIGNLGAQPPYYHAWRGNLHQTASTSDTAVWQVSIPQDGQYGFQTWLPAAPSANSWTKAAVYDLLVNGQVAASATLDQTTAAGSDQWFSLFTNVPLLAAQSVSLRIRYGGVGILVADAIDVKSAARYNDGSVVNQISLAPFDAIFLQRVTPVQANNTANVAPSWNTNIRSYIPAALAGSGYTSYLRVINTGTTTTPVWVAVVNGTTGVVGASGQLAGSLPAGGAVTFSAQQVETALGAPLSAGDRSRIQVTTTAPIEVQSFQSNPMGIVTENHDAVTGASSYYVPSYIPASLAASGYYSFIRIINVGTAATAINVQVVDGDTGVAGATGQLTASVPAGGAVTYTAQQIEAALGATVPASSRPRILVTGSVPLEVQSFQSNPGGVVTENGNARAGTSVPVQSYIPAALSVSGYTSFVRIINMDAQSTSIGVSLIDASTGQTTASGQLVAALAANAAVTFSAQQIEAALGVVIAAQDRPRILVTSPSNNLNVQSFQANPRGVVTQNSESRSGVSIDVRSYIPAALAGTGYYSFIRIINTSSKATPVSVALIDGTTGVVGDAKQLTASLPGGGAVTFTAQQIEDALGSALAAGDRPRIRVTATVPVEVQSFQSNPLGIVTENGGAQ